MFLCDVISLLIMNGIRKHKWKECTIPTINQQICDSVIIFTHLANVSMKFQVQFFELQTEYVMLPL